MIHFPTACFLKTEAVQARSAHGQDAPLLARYHQEHEDALRPWDISWNPRRRQTEWHVEEMGKPDRWTGVLLAGNDADSLVGVLELHRRGVEYSLAYSLAPTFRSRGWMTLALSALRRELEHQLKPPRGHADFMQQHASLVALIREDNMASARLADRVGFQDHGPDSSFPAVPVEGRWRRHHRWVLPLRNLPPPASSAEDDGRLSPR